MSYNQDSSKKYGWEPSWFGVAGFGPELDKAIAKFQKDYGLEADGMCGPGTVRRLLSERALASNEDVPPSPKGKDYIIVNGERCPIAWDKVVTYDEPNSFKAPSGTYRAYKGKRDVKMFVNHWDVCINSSTCNNVLVQRGISVHFLIDNDGTIYQTVDANDIAWHAGGKTLNDCTVGVEISNAFYPKYQEWYTKRYGARPVKEGVKLNGKSVETHLGFYPIQMQAAKALWEAIAAVYNIPLVTPTNADGSELAAVHPGASEGNYRGIVHHYNLTERKMDCAGFDLTQFIGKTV